MGWGWLRGFISLYSWLGGGARDLTVANWVYQDVPPSRGLIISIHLLFTRIIYDV